MCVVPSPECRHFVLAASIVALRTAHPARAHRTQSKRISPRTQEAATDTLPAPYLPHSCDRYVLWLDAIWDQLFPAEQQRIVRLLIEKVIVSPNDLEARFRPNGIEVLALDLQPELSAETIEEAVT